MTGDTMQVNSVCKSVRSLATQDGFGEFRAPRICTRKSNAEFRSIHCQKRVTLLLLGFFSNWYVGSIVKPPSVASLDVQDATASMTEVVDLSDFQLFVCSSHAFLLVDLYTRGCPSILTFPLSEPHKHSPPQNYPKSTG